MMLKLGGRGKEERCIIIMRNTWDEPARRIIYIVLWIQVDGCEGSGLGWISPWQSYAEAVLFLLF